MRGRSGFVYAVGYIATIFAANWAVARFGIVPVGFGLAAPAGVYFAGLAFTLRDLTQDALGKRAVVVAILIGAACSAAVSPSLALASGAAFLVSEGIDFAIYTPIRESGHRLTGVFASNVVGLTIDSALFLWLAFHSLQFFWGQVVGKAWMTALALVVMRAVLPRNSQAVVARKA